MHSFYFRVLQLGEKRKKREYIFNFNSQFLYELKQKVHLSQTVCEIFHFKIRFVFIKVYAFMQQKAYTL